jgi:hypothetical protein
LLCVARAITIFMEPQYFTINEKNSSYLMPYSCSKPLLQVLNKLNFWTFLDESKIILNIHFVVAHFPIGTSTKSHVWFLCIESILKSIATFHSLSCQILIHQIEVHLTNQGSYNVIIKLKQWSGDSSWPFWFCYP